MCVRLRDVLKPSTLPEHAAQKCIMLQARVFAQAHMLRAGSVLPIWQTLFDVLARSSSSSHDGEGKKVWLHSAVAPCMRFMTARMLAMKSDLQPQALYLLHRFTMSWGGTTAAGQC